MHIMISNNICTGIIYCGILTKHHEQEYSEASRFYVFISFLILYLACWIISMLIAVVG